MPRSTHRTEGQVWVEIDTTEFEKELSDFLIENAETIAKQIARDAKATTAFKDVTGELRKSIRAKKSRYPDGGWIVRAGGPKAAQAWLIENGRSGGAGYPPMPAKPFLKPAMERNIDEAKRLFGVK